MKRATPILWGISLTLFAAMLGMYLGGVGILVGSTGQRFVLREGNKLAADDGTRRPNQSPPFTATVCSYWEGFRVHKILQPHADARCAIFHGPA